MFLQPLFYQGAECRSITFTTLNGSLGIFTEHNWVGGFNRGYGCGMVWYGMDITGGMGPQTPLKMITMNWRQPPGGYCAIHIAVSYRHFHNTTYILWLLSMYHKLSHSYKTYSRHQRHTSNLKFWRRRNHIGSFFQLVVTVPRPSSPTSRYG